MERELFWTMIEKVLMIYWTFFFQVRLLNSQNFGSSSWQVWKSLWKEALSATFDLINFKPFSYDSFLFFFALWNLKSSKKNFINFFFQQKRKTKCVMKKILENFSMHQKTENLQKNLHQFWTLSSFMNIKSHSSSKFILNSPFIDGISSRFSSKFLQLFFSLVIFGWIYLHKRLFNDSFQYIHLQNYFLDIIKKPNLLAHFSSFPQSINFW